MTAGKYWKDGIMGLVTADALGVPVEFMDRKKLAKDPVLGMRSYGTYHLPAGCWSDDSSMTLAALDSLQYGYDPADMMERFVRWYQEGEYTPMGEVFDIGIASRTAIMNYMASKDWKTCGCYGEYNNGNGSLMRILPVCFYVFEQQMKDGMGDDSAISVIHEASSLTHGHLRSKIACGLYYFMVKSLLQSDEDLVTRLQCGLDEGFSYYEKDGENQKELAYFARIRDLREFAKLSESEIRSSGYVVDSLEAALWCLVNEASYPESMLRAVNLGSDTDTVAAIAGGLAGIYYGYEGIPEDWLAVIKKREWIEEFLRMAGMR